MPCTCEAGSHAVVVMVRRRRDNEPVAFEIDEIRGREAVGFAPIKSMRYIALAEATSFIALLVASFVKRTGGGELGVQILGPIHGVLFIAYVVIALKHPPSRWAGAARRPSGSWSARSCPFGGYVVDWWLLRERAAHRVLRGRRGLAPGAGGDAGARTAAAVAGGDGAGIGDRAVRARATE